MGAPYAARRPGGVTLVMVLTWISAILALIAGIWLVIASNETLAELDLSSSTARIYGIAEIVWGVLAALVAIGLGSGSGAARMLVSVLMVVRIAGAIYGAIILAGSTGFVSVLVSGAIALIVLLLLWTSKADAFFREN